MNKKCIEAEIDCDKLQKDYKYRNVVVLRTTINNFYINSPNNRETKIINNRLFSQQKHFFQNATRVLYPQAVEDYIYRIQNNFPFNPYEAFVEYTLTFNSNCLFSFYYDNYTFTGGAHGNTTRLANTYSLITGESVPLSALFKESTNYKQMLLDAITEQAEQNMQSNEYIYFENYRDLIIETFNERSFYLTKQGLVIYYGQYDIAPYSSGIIEFTIPYECTDFPPTCENWCPD